MKRIFISQPMNGKSEAEILATRKVAVDFVKRYLGFEDVEVIDSYFPDAPSDGNRGLYLLGKSLELLATADIAYFAHGWENYRGCRIENQCAVEYGIPFIEDTILT